MKTGKELEATYCLGCENYIHNFKFQEVKMSLEKNHIVLFVDLVNQDF